MKKIVLTLSATALLLSAQAQLFSPESFSGALWGSLIGGVVGGDCRHGFSGEGAAIGAGAGLLAGAILGETRRQASVGYGYNSSPAPACSSPYVYCAPNSYCAAPIQPQQSQPASRQTDPKPQTRQTKPAGTAKGISASQPVLHQIPDAPRVPDAPTF
ncbi:MAG TPA: hypothetical protein VFR76_15570 [Verrucomicrobiae bacterium]|nr:hypothetical protein [Verrucomicrobiae bacterium]